jgi:uncharacterized protein
MNPLFEVNKEKIIALCKTHFVKELATFGSINTDKFNNESDIDFLYIIDIEKFNNWATGNYDYTDNLLSLESKLNKLFDRKIDLVPADVINQNKYMRKSVEQSKKIVYAA